MNKNYHKHLFVGWCILSIFAGCSHPANKQSKGTKKDTLLIKDSIPQNVKKIIKAYPNLNILYKENHLIFDDGTSIVYDDGKKKAFEEMLDDSDIEDMFSMSYDKTSVIPAYLNDCGRSRNEAFFQKIYGKSESEVRKNLVKIDWFGVQILFTKINGASIQLEKVKQELMQHEHLKKYLTNSSSFYWRKVRGANRQSAHSYGIAIDINTSYSNYWLWSNPKANETSKIKYENQIPVEIVNIFEKHGFIWGGRWYHYDTMHFEYRPELLI